MIRSWQLVLGLYVINAHSIHDWDVDTQITDMVTSKWVPGNGITNSARLALANLDGPSKFAQPPGGSNLVSSEISISQGTHRCAFDTKQLPRRIKEGMRIHALQIFFSSTTGKEKGASFSP